jgi:hypothetical protein
MLTAPTSAYFCWSRRPWGEELAAARGVDAPHRHLGPRPQTSRTILSPSDVQVAQGVLFIASLALERKVEGGPDGAVPRLPGPVPHGQPILVRSEELTGGQPL